MSDPDEATVVEEDGCFRIVDTDGSLWVEEHRHWQVTPVRMRLRFGALTSARSYRAGLRPQHDHEFHGRAADAPYATNHTDGTPEFRA